MHALPQYTTTSNVYVSWDHSIDPFAEVDLGSGVNHYDLFRNSAWLVDITDTGLETLYFYDDTSVSEGQYYDYKSSATDNVGHESAQSDYVSTTIDTIAPATTHAATGTLGDNGWYKENDITITLSATDATSGVKQTNYRVLPNPFEIYTGAFLLSDGIHDVEYYSKDYANNQETAKAFNVKVDTIKPVTTDNAPSGWQANDVAVALTPTDTLSGVAETYYCIDQSNICLPETSGTSVLVTTEGINYVRYYSRDNAGNNEDEEFAEVKIDKSAPAASFLTGLPEWDTDGTANLAWTASTDAYSGFDHYEVWRRDEPAAGTPVDYRKISPDLTSLTFADTALPTDTTYYYKIYACDKVGHCIFSNIESITVDTENPSVQITTPYSEQIFNINSVTVTADYANTYLVNCVASMDSGIEYDMAGDNQVSGTATYTFTGIADSEHDFTVICTDEAGNTQTDTVYDIFIDTVAPVTIDNAPAGCKNVKPITITLTANDPAPGTGVSATYYCTDTTNTCTPNTEGTEIVIDAEGTTYIRYYSVDNAGNEETVKSTSVFIDTIAPDEQLQVTASDTGTCIGEFMHNGIEYKTGLVVIGNGETIYVGNCLTLENLITDATSGVGTSSIDIKSSSGRLIQTVSSPGPSEVDFANVETQLLDSEECWVDLVLTANDNCGNSKTITIRAVLDEDGDGVCNAADLCDDTFCSVPTYIPTSGELNPNHYEDIDCDGVFEVGIKPKGSYADSTVTLEDAHGCTCQQILDKCHPGNVNGQYKYGCTTGTLINVWIPQTGWAGKCIADGAKEEKAADEDTDEDGVIDSQDTDDDNDGITDEEDSEPESVPAAPGKSGTGRPDWWCAKHPDKC